jgi:ABC-type uncharacterized transport system substrate-binding protein
MTNNTAKVRLNEVLVNKLDSMQYDIKYYVNVNYGNHDNAKVLEDSDLEELIKIRTMLKSLTNRMKKQLSQ